MRASRASAGADANRIANTTIAQGHTHYPISKTSQLTNMRHDTFTRTIQIDDRTKCARRMRIPFLVRCGTFLSINSVSWITRRRHEAKRYLNRPLSLKRYEWVVSYKAV